jgi:hypothetical protein
MRGEPVSGSLRGHRCASRSGNAMDEEEWPLPTGKEYAQESVFRPENLLREARRQRHLPEVAVPGVCLLDPDGDVVRYLAGPGKGRRHPGWGCYHTDMWVRSPKRIPQNLYLKVYTGISTLESK